MSDKCFILNFKKLTRHKAFCWKVYTKWIEAQMKKNTCLCNSSIFSIESKCQYIFSTKQTPYSWLVRVTIRLWLSITNVQMSWGMCYVVSYRCVILQNPIGASNQPDWNMKSRIFNIRLAALFIFALPQVSEHQHLSYLMWHRISFSD